MTLRSRLSPASLLALALSAPASMAAPLPDPLPCTACFVGEVKLRLNPADPSGRTKTLDDDLYFIDPSGTVWKANKGDVTDGASIPPLLQPIVGNAFENDFLPAAIIHDHYTDKAHRVRSWKLTALVFYQALVVRGVNAIKAKTMYYAVYTFGPHWGEVATGVYCGRGCINAVPASASAATEHVEEPSNYEADHQAEMEAVQAKIAAQELRGEPLSLDALQQEARARHTGSVFLSPPLLPNDR